MYAVGVHLDPAVTTFVVLDLVGAVVKHSRIKTPGGNRPGAVIDTIAAEIKQLITDSGVDPAKIAGLGIASPGPIDLEEGTVVDPPLLLGWDRVPLRDALAAATGLSTLVDKDVTSAAVAETWAGGPSGAGSFVFMYMGTGIGCGIVLNDEVVRGTSGNAGEIGHIIVDPDGALCDCGMRGCVKSSSIPQVLVARPSKPGCWTAPSRPERSRGPGELRRTVRRRRRRRPEGADIIDSPPSWWPGPSRPSPTPWTWTASCSADPFWTCLSQRYLERIPELVGENSATRKIHEIEVVGTGVGEDVGAIGAACLVLEHTLAPRSQRLLLEG